MPSLDWRSASKLSFLRWPAIVAFAGTFLCSVNLTISGNRGLSIGPLELHLFDLLCLLACVLVATLPVWYYTTSRYVQGKAKLGAAKQILIAMGLFMLALLVAPGFKIAYSEYYPWSEDYRRDFTTTLVKRSLIESLQMPQLAVDELRWLQSNYNAVYIPAEVFCPRRSTRLYPLFGIVQDDDILNALTSEPPFDALESAVAQCNQQGPAMLAAGYTKESALLQGDIERFFALNAFEESPNESIVLTDAQIPSLIMAKIEAFLKKPTEDSLIYSVSPYVYGQVRRLKPLVLAEALGRSDDIARLRNSE